MKLFFHYCLAGFSNCYLLGTDFSGDGTGSGDLREALIVDPGCMDDQIVSFIEDNDYALRGVLITHDHLNHVHGLRTLKKIYNADIYAVNHIISEYRTVRVKDGGKLTIGPFKVEVITVPGHSSDSAVFKISHMLFTGDALSAGLVGTTASSYGASVQMTALRSKILSLPGDFTVLPGHGPPTTLETERRYNVGINAYEQSKSKKSQIVYSDIW
ncbi:MBL fold metallo-hydrolase [Breznakiella homolactica]|uniref:MBL fold metallo-hydrolase n=1 Tax=Breznakiella homolactica TaxID=2798577 RepID=A0A7T8BAW5_9SPIR|nr:MBL fold metallo-hydrolase [Breznakiella homolactica]QQO08598.1 MBL fold metallo-hydrolase [Breznakiella homolactica]